MERIKRFAIRLELNILSCALTIFNNLIQLASSKNCSSLKKELIISNSILKMESDAQFLHSVITALVDKPESVKIDRTVDEMGVLLTLTVSPEDMGKVIGRSGNTAKAIRTLLRVVGMKNNARVNLKINEPEGSTRAVPNAAKSVDEAVGDFQI